MDNIISINEVSKIYDNGFKALDAVSLNIKRGEILALLGPNGAGKTSLISVITGIVSATAGSITIDGHDHVANYRQARKLIGLVPQELTLGAFDTVYSTVAFSRGLFGAEPKPQYLKELLTRLSLWDKKDNQLRMLSGGMRRRVLIAKALSHEPKILFLDEPTAGVDVELRKDMWLLIDDLRRQGVTIILTTHYIEEAEEIADRVAVINGGKIHLVEEKAKLMSQFGSKQLFVDLRQPVEEVPKSLQSFDIEKSADGSQLIYTYQTTEESTGITALLQAISDAGLSLKDIQTTQSTLEEIFVELVKGTEQDAMREGSRS